ncbi:restriction endonuclease subunit S [Sulfitobacter sp. S0837]|nr:restriction endonuclease subunit S [Sulfitobacter maritimus]
METEEGIPVYGSGGPFTFASTYLYDKESVLLGRKGTINKPLFVDHPFWTVDTMYYTEIDEETPAKFLYYLATTIQFGRYSTSTALPSMTQEHLANHSFALPKDKNEQAQIAAFLDHETAKIDELIAKQERLIALLEEKRRAVLRHAVTRGLNPDAPLRPSGIDWLGDVPAHWEMKPLKYLCSFTGGGTPSKDVKMYWTDGLVPWVSPKDMKTFYLSDTQDRITPAAVGGSSTNYIEEGALLMVVRSGILQRTIPIAINKVRVTLNQDMKALRFSGLVDVEYAANYILGHQEVLLHEWSKEGATVESIEHEYLCNHLFPVPPIEEQTQIRKFLDQQKVDMDSLLAKSRSAITLLKERRTALISAAVTGKIDIRGWQPPKDILDQDTAQKAFA